MNFIVLDTETGGLRPGRHSLLEVGLIAYKDSKVVGEFSSYLQSEEYVVTPVAMEINGLNLSEVHEKGLPQQQLVDAILDFINKHFSSSADYQLLGHNLAFDKYMLQHLFDEVGVNMDNHINYRMVDTTGLITICKELGLLSPDTPGSLHKIAKQFGVLRPGTEHTALGDCYTTLAVYEELMGLLKGAIHGTNH